MSLELPVLLLATIATPADRVATAATPIDRLVVFGDSLSDTGNIDFISQGLIPGPDYYIGRFSNGPIWIDDLASMLGIDSPDCLFCGGTNMACGGASTGNGYTSFVIPNMGQQVVFFSQAGFVAEPGDLFVLFGGANDFFMGQSDPDLVVTNLNARITSLALIGATEFLVPNLPPLGQTPAYVGTPESTTLDGLASAFNAALESMLQNVQRDLGVTIHRFDTHALFESILSDPAAYGLEVLDVPAYDELTGAVVANPEVYLFWDELHPTTTAHAIFASLVHAALACPADLNGDGAVDGADLGVLLGAFGEAKSRADLNGDGVTDGADLSELFAAWGACSSR